MHDIAICITLTLEIFISMGQQINFVQQYVVVGAKKVVYVGMPILIYIFEEKSFNVKSF